MQAAARGASIVIWTTTPWTLPGNRAISFSPRIAYGLYEVTEAPPDNWAKAGDIFILADALAADVMAQARVLPTRSARRSSRQRCWTSFVRPSAQRLRR